MTDSWDPVAFTEAQRRDWQVASSGWRKWYEMLEAGGEIVSRKLVELTGIGPGDTVLDVATGYGEPALTAAPVVGPTGKVVATDIADGMLAFGRERAAHAQLDNVEFVEADAHTLSFGEETFDAIVCRQGLQFLPDVSGTLQRWRAFLKRDGRLAVSVWGPPDTVQFARPVSVILAELGLPAPPPGRPGIFALADRHRLARLLADAGFRDVASGTITAVYETNSPSEFTQWAKDVAPPIANLLNGQPPETQERVWAKVTDAWASLTTPDGRVRTENQAIWLAATR